MADLLPQFIVLKPAVLNNNKCTYVYYSAELAHKCILANGTDVFDPYAKIEVETAKIDRNYFHLRFYHSNRYWARSEDDKCMVPVSKQPEEDRSKPSCTLFELTLSTDKQIRFTHVHSGKRVRTDPKSTIIYADDGADGDYAFSFVDWDTLVKIPPRVAFKGDNGKYLQGDYYYYFSSSDGNEESAAYEVTLHPDGHLSIKSVNYGKFWNVNSKGWICGDSDQLDGNNIDSLFWPYKIDDQTIALRNAKEKKFCTRFTDDCLNASTHNITKEAHLVVEELVSKRSIYHVEYRMEDARVYDEQPFLAGKNEAVNESHIESSVDIMLSYQHTHTTSFSNTLSIMLGGKTNIEVGIPFIADGKIEISGSVTNNSNWGNTTVEHITGQTKYIAKVPPNSRVVVHYVGTKGTCSVPFSYTSRDTSSSDGQVVTSRHIDGVFLGTNCYNFHFQQPKIEPLSPSS